MLKMTDLKAKLLALPEERKQAKRIANVRHFHEKVLELTAKLERARNQRRLIPQVFAAADLTRVDEQTAKAGRAAAKLHRLLTLDMENITGAAANNGVATLGSHVESAEKSCLGEWKKQVEAKVRDYGQLVTALAEIDPDIGMKSRQVIDRLAARAPKPPANDNDAKALLADTVALARSIETMGLEGEVGAFVVGALGKGVHPSELEKPEIRKFLDKSNRWDLFTVKFRSAVQTPG
jgi:hypothetical protein